MKPLKLAMLAGTLLACTALPASAHVGFGISFGPYYGTYWGPGYFGPGYGPYYRPYYPRYVYPAWVSPRYFYPAYVYPGYAYPRPYYPAPAYYAPPPPRPAPPPKQAAVAPAPLIEKATLSATELFEFDEALLHAPQPKLDDIARALVDNPNLTNVRITGYTDRLGTEDYNLKLSKRRAEAVKTYLVRKGVAANRLTAIGKGKENPVADCNQLDRDELVKCLEPNRRVEVEPITIEKKTARS